MQKAPLILKAVKLLDVNCFEVNCGPRSDHTTSGMAVQQNN